MPFLQQWGSEEWYISEPQKKQIELTGSCFFYASMLLLGLLFNPLSRLVIMSLTMVRIWMVLMSLRVWRHCNPLWVHGYPIILISLREKGGRSQKMSTGGIETILGGSIVGYFMSSKTCICIIKHAFQEFRSIGILVAVELSRLRLVQRLLVE